MYNIIDYGAVGDGVTVNTAAIQRAVDECSNAGGGRVVVPSGTFVSGTIRLRDNVELHLAAPTSILLGSRNFDDYNSVDAYEQNWKSINEQTNGGHFIMAVEVKNVSITGFGIIDGNGDAFMNGIGQTTSETYCFWPHGFSIVADKERTRPSQMIAVVESENIVISGITLRNSPYWTLFLHGCDKVRVHHLLIENPPHRLNGDGIDIDCTSNITVSDCIIRTGDDALTLRADNAKLKNKNKCTENVVVSNCILTSGGANAIRIGVGDGHIKNAVFSNLVLTKSVGGIHVQSKYSDNGLPTGTHIQNVRFSNISGTDLRVPVFFNSGFTTAAYIKDVVISDSYFDLEHTCGIIGNNIGEVSGIVWRNLTFNVVNRLPGIDSHEFDCHRYGTHSPCLDTVLMFANTEIELENVKVRFTSEARKAWKYDIIFGENVIQPDKK